MRHRVLVGIGILEAILACVLVVIGFLLPRTESIETSFDRAGHLTRSAETQVRSMREQLGELRRRDFPKLAAQLRSQTRDFSAKWRESPLDLPSAETMTDSVAQTSSRLDDWSNRLDEFGRFPNSAGTITSIPGAASPLGRSTKRSRDVLEANAAQLEAEYQAIPLELGKPLDVASFVRVITSMDRIERAAASIENAANSDRLADLREAIEELELSLETAHQQAETFSSVSMPLPIPNGGTPGGFQMVPLWPQGKRVARNLGQSLNVVRSVNRQLGEFSRSAERLRLQPDPMSAFAASRQMRALALSLSRCYENLDRSLADWPNMVQTMRSSARLLRGSNQQLDDLMTQRPDYERAVLRGKEATLNAEDVVQSYSKRIDTRLGEQEQSLGQMEHGLREAGDAIPGVSQTAVDLLNAIRWMFWLVGALIALHGAFVICEARRPLAA